MYIEREGVIFVSYLLAPPARRNTSPRATVRVRATTGTAARRLPARTHRDGDGESLDRVRDLEDR